MSRGYDLILTYHRIGGGRDPLQQCVDVERFAQHIERLPSLADVVPLESLETPSRRPRIALTFDDGYADNGAVAAPILREAGLPATFFIPSRVLAERGEFWWDRLEHLHLDSQPETASVDVAPAGRRLRIDVRSEAGRLRSLKALNRRLRPLPPAAIEAVVRDVESQLGPSVVRSCAAHSLLDGAAVAALAATALFEIGCHGATHTMLSALTAREAELEIRESREALESATGRSVTSFSYPYGTPESFGAETIALVRAAGFARACRNTPGRADFARERYRLARHMVYDWSGDELAARVNSWLVSS